MTDTSLQYANARQVQTFGEVVYTEFHKDTPHIEWAGLTGEQQLNWDRAARAGLDHFHKLVEEQQRMQNAAANTLNGGDGKYIVSVESLSGSGPEDTPVGKPDGGAVSGDDTQTPATLGEIAYLAFYGEDAHGPFSEINHDTAACWEEAAAKVAEFTMFGYRPNTSIVIKEM